MKCLVIFISFLFCFSTFAFKYIDAKATLESLDDYRECHLRKYPSSACQAALNDWLETHPKDTLEAARQTSLLMNARVAIPLFYRAANLEGEKSFSCEDPKLLNSLVNAFEGSLSEKVLKQSLFLIHERCSNSSLGRKTVSSIKFSSKHFQLVCKPFKKKGLLMGVRKKKCK